MISPVQILLLVTWLGISGMLFLLTLIARFYEVSARTRTYYQAYLLPLILYTIANIRYIWLDRWGGDTAGDILLFTAGTILMGLCLYLYSKMTGGRG